MARAKAVDATPSGVMGRGEALAWLKTHELPPQPSTMLDGLEARTCHHAGTPRLCSCHLTPEQTEVAQALGDHVLYLFGYPYTGRLRVPFYPSSLGAVAHESPQAPVAAAAPAREHHGPSPASVAGFDKSAYNRLWAKAKAEGPEALAAFKAAWKAGAAR